jgi:hypothetical protein
VAEGAEEPEEGAAVLEPVVATVVATATVLATVMAILVVTVLVMALVMAAVTAAAMVTVLLPRATTTAGEATWSAPVAGQRSRHQVANIGPAPRQDASPPRHLETLIRAAE